MKVIIVDDEKLALLKLEKLLHSQIGANLHLELAGAYQDPYAALAAAREVRPDVAFLDIEMPEVSGFELAEKLLELQPQMQIVFVTAYQDFAIKAFEVNALDYLLKPVNASRLNVTLNRVVRFSLLNAAGANQDQAGKDNALLPAKFALPRPGRPTEILPMEDAESSGIVCVSDLLPGQDGEQTGSDRFAVAGARHEKSNNSVTYGNLSD